VEQPSFIKIFGLSPETRLLNLFLSRPGEPFKKSTISRLTGISRTILSGICSLMDDKHIIKNTNAGYVFNMYDSRSKNILDFYKKLKEDYDEIN